MSEQISIQVQEIAVKKEIPPLDRIIQILLATRVTDRAEKALIEELHKTQNALLHQKTTLLDDGIFQLEKAQAARVFEALVHMMEKMLDLKDGSLFERMCEYWKF